MAVIDWPNNPAFYIKEIAYGAITPKSAWSSFFTGQVQSISHVGDRLRATLTLNPCKPEDGAIRESFWMYMQSSGAWLRLPHWRLAPFGTLRGSPTVAASAAAGARTLSVQTTAGATLLGGDVLGVGGQLCITSYQGAVANGSGVIAMPLVLPLRAAVSAGATVEWSAPLGTWQLATDDVRETIGRAGWHRPIEIPLVEAYA